MCVCFLFVHLFVSVGSTPSMEPYGEPELRTLRPEPRSGATLNPLSHPGTPPMCLFFKVRATNRASAISKRGFLMVQRVSVPILSMVLGGSRFSDTRGSCYLRQWESSLERKYYQPPLFPFQGSICGSQVTTQYSERAHKLQSLMVKIEIPINYFF